MERRVVPVEMIRRIVSIYAWFFPYDTRIRRNVTVETATSWAGDIDRVETIRRSASTKTSVRDAIAVPGRHYAAWFVRWSVPPSA